VTNRRRREVFSYKEGGFWCYKNSYILNMRKMFEFRRYVFEFGHSIFKFWTAVMDDPGGVGK